MRVVIAGELPLIQDVSQLCVSAGYDTNVFLVEDFLGAIESGYVLDEIGAVDVAVELHNESAAAKQELILALDNALPPDCLLLSSALATSATQAAAWTRYPERVVGFGLLPPVGPAGLVELAAALQTSDAALGRAKEFWAGLQYEPVLVADGPGLVRARLVCCIINEAVSALMEGVAAPEDIDRAMRLGTNYPFGPLEWADIIGLDTVLGVMTGLFAEWGDDRYRPAPWLRRMVIAGMSGKKTGRGFYRYDETGSRI